MHLVYVSFGVLDSAVCFRWLEETRPIRVREIDGFPLALYNTLVSLTSLPHLDAVQQISIEALNWVLSAQETQPAGTSTMRIFLSALLGLDVTAEAALVFGVVQTRTTRQFVARYLPFEVRLELLKTILHGENHSIHLHMVDELLTSREGNEGTHYLPTMVLSAVNKNHWLDQKVFRPSQVQEDDVDAIRFRREDTPHTPHSLSFQAIYSMIGQEKLESGDLLNQMELCRIGYFACVEATGRSSSFSLVLSMRQVSCAIHLLNDWIAFILQRIQADASYQVSTNQYSEAVLQIVSTAPRTWSTYLLSRVKDVGVLVELLHNERFCSLIGARWWYVERVDEAAGPGNDLHSITRFRDLKVALRNRIAGIRFATALVDFAIQQQQMDLPLMIPLLSLTAPPLFPEEDIRGKAVRLVLKLVNIDFNDEIYMNTFIHPSRRYDMRARAIRKRQSIRSIE
jgi:hypothetical protein